MGATSAWPDLWDIALAERAPADARAKLLTMHAELFASAPVRDREAIESFEAIALGFMPLVGAPTLGTIARLLAPCDDTPESVLTYLAQFEPATRAIVVALAPALPPRVVEVLLGSAHGRVLLALREDLDPSAAERLVQVHEGAVDAALARNRALSATAPAFTSLVQRARRNRSLAASLLRRDDLLAADAAALFLSADPDERVAIQDRVASSALFQRPHAPPRLPPSDVAQLLRASARGDVPAFEAQLSCALGFPAGTEWSIVDDHRHDLLALALAACGVPEEDATRVFLTLHPALSHSIDTVFGLVRLFRQVTRPVALALVEAILGTIAAPERIARHQPAMSGASLPARAAATTNERAREGGAERHRRAV